MFKSFVSKNPNSKGKISVGVCTLDRKVLWEGAEVRGDLASRKEDFKILSTTKKIKVILFAVVFLMFNLGLSLLVFKLSYHINASMRRDSKIEIELAHIHTLQHTLHLTSTYIYIYIYRHTQSP
jgi:hypothetical protein